MAGQDLMRLEVQVPSQDAGLIEAVAASLADPGTAPMIRAMLGPRFAFTPTYGLKDLLARAPLDGIDLDRSRDHGRDIEL